MFQEPVLEKTDTIRLSCISLIRFKLALETSLR